MGSVGLGNADAKGLSLLTLLTLYLMFGCKKASEIFHRITKAVHRIMARKGFNAIVVYLDDFFIIGDSELACRTALETLISLLSNLGFQIN